MFVGKTTEGAGRPDLVGKGPACGVCACDDADGFGVVEEDTATVFGHVVEGDLEDDAADTTVVVVVRDGLGDAAFADCLGYVIVILDFWSCLK